LRQIERNITKINTAMLEPPHQDQHISELLDILSKMSRIASTKALMNFVDVPEISPLHGKQVACLAGLAPLSKISGKWQGKARIQGGRPNLRHAIFIPTRVAFRHNPGLMAEYEKCFFSRIPASSSPQMG
jgi:transposase